MIERLFKQAIIGTLLLVAVVGGAYPVAQATGAQTKFFVDVNSGHDNGTCGTQTQPCASIQRVVNIAPSGSTIKVAAGTYTFAAANDSCSNQIGTTAVVCVLNKELSLLGGFATDDWLSAKPEMNATIIDGENKTRALLVQHGNGQPPATLHMEGFTVQNGYVKGASSGADAATFAFGAGLRADRSTIILRNMIFRNNQAIGGDTTNDYGGAAAGGGIALRDGPNGSILENVVFEGNKALGGRGVNRGGYGIGGGLYTFESHLSGRFISLTGNLAMGGSANGSGVGPVGDNADGQGGGAAFHRNSVVTINHLTAENNNVVGGSAPQGQAGGAFGGGIWVEGDTILELISARIVNNEVNGGNGENASRGGSLAFGGGLGVQNSDISLNQISILNNQAIGGNGAIISGSGNGGGISLTRTLGDSRAQIHNTVIVNNRTEMGAGNVSGGGGGGILMRGAHATIEHSTIAQNQIGRHMQGSGMVLLSSSMSARADIAYSIVAQHTKDSTAYALHVQPGNVINLETGLFDGNAKDYGGGGTVNGVGTMLSAPPSFRSPGNPDYDYHIEEHSAARNAATTSTAAVDVDGDPRDSKPDIGADEYMPAGIAKVSLLPLVSNEAVEITWSGQGGVGNYEVAVSCSSGAKDPNEVRCGSALDLGLATQVRLTGLTESATYSVDVQAFDNEGTLVDSNEIAFTTDFHFALLPFVSSR